MTTTMLYKPAKNWPFGVALGIAAMIHLAAIGFADVRQVGPNPAAVLGESTQLFFESEQSSVGQPPEQLMPLPTPPSLDPSFIEERATPLPIPRPPGKFLPLTKPHKDSRPGPFNLSSAKVFAVSAPRPGYPYEARRQRISGDGVVTLTVDPVTGVVVDVSMSKSTGNQFLDNAALTGFRRWRFRPGTVSSVTCPITFTLTGAAY